MLEALSPVLGRVVSGVFILTVRHGDHETGMLSSWVMQAGFEPPMLTAAIRKGRFVEQWLSAGAIFNINVLAEGQTKMLRHFGAGFEPHEPAFEGLAISRTSRGVPILDEAPGYLECKPISHIDSGDHRIILAEIIGGRMSEELKPMIHIRKNGLRY